MAVGAYHHRMKTLVRRLASSASLAAALPAAIAGLLLSSCVTKKEPPSEPEKPSTPEKPKELYQWNGKGRTATHVKININEQKAHVFSGKEEIGWATVATGIFKYPTPVGDFKVMEKVVDKKSNLFGKTYTSGGKLVNSDAKMGRDPIPEGGRFEGARMPYYMRLTGDGVGMHAGPIPKPGYRASHGCIRMPRSFAPLIFASVSVGTPVSIVGEGPSYASYLKRQQSLAPKVAKKTDAAAGTAKPDGGPAAAPAAGAASNATPASDVKPGAEKAPPAAAPAAKEPAIEIKPAVTPSAPAPQGQ